MSIDLKDYEYSLPEENIAKFPLTDRSASKLLFYQKGTIRHQVFGDIVDVLPENSLLVFNDTRVIPARLIFHRESGARIEVFLLEPLSPTSYEQAMRAFTQCTWKCMIGNAKRWKNEKLHHPSGLSAQRVDDIVTFTWDSGQSFSEILDSAGSVPLPPYIGRTADEHDKETYQTVYSKYEGAVAAPTAGLHFTKELLAQLPSRNISMDFVTLHVSAGTFQPIKASNVMEHPMHREQVIVSLENVESLLKAERVIAVGTTSMRTLESLYWFGVKLLEGNEDFFIEKEFAYCERTPISFTESLTAVKDYLIRTNQQKLAGHTEIFIYPGYEFRVCKGLITNFHLPGSTLILLVAAFIGKDWKRIYDEALKNHYRFLSYGDSSVLFP
jgi:S-adenosylmethionine:tRNA ribosyltransferase-isomerase